MKISRSAQTCALGSAIRRRHRQGAQGLCLGTEEDDALEAEIYKPDPKAHAIYQELYALYKELHDAFGSKEWNGNLFGVMKQVD